MVSIPTTERKYYNFTPKVNTFYLAADTAYNIAKGATQVAEKYQDYKQEQERTKMDSFTTQARLDMNKATNEWRIANESNPDDPEALKELNAQYDDIMNSYREQLSPYSRKAWDTQITTKLKGAYSLENQAWAFKQVQTNAANHIKNEVKNYNDLAFSYGSSGSEDSLGAALADFASMTDKLTTFGAKNLGVETAAQMLNGAEVDYVKSYINGVASVDPEKALAEMETDEVKIALGAEYDSAKKIITAARRQAKYDHDTQVYVFQNKLQNELDNMPPTEAIKYLNQNISEVTEAFYKAQSKAIERRAGLTAATSSDVFAELYEEINVPLDSPETKLAHSVAMQEKIMQRYADLKLSLKHKDSLLKMVDADNMKTNLFDFTKEADEEGAGWIFYKNQDAINDIKNAFPNMITRNEAIMNYAINIGDLQIEGKDISGKKRKEMAQQVIKSFQSKEINTAVKQEKVNTLKEIKEGDKIGRFKVVGVREK
jgi:hypothetical protein